MTKYGLLIDYEWCTGCRSCEVSCKEEHDYPVGVWGIRVYEDGPWEIDSKHSNWNKVPVPTDLCDLCIDRTQAGKLPICVHHCLADVISYGPVEELAKRLEEKGRQALFVPDYLPFEKREDFVSQNEKASWKAVGEAVAANNDFEFALQRGREGTDLDL